MLYAHLWRVSVRGEAGGSGMQEKSLWGTSAKRWSPGIPVHSRWLPFEDGNAGVRGDSCHRCSQMQHLYMYIHTHPYPNHSFPLILDLSIYFIFWYRKQGDFLIRSTVVVSEQVLIPLLIEREERERRGSSTFLQDQKLSGDFGAGICVCLCVCVCICVWRGKVQGALTQMWI